MPTCLGVRRDVLCRTGLETTRTSPTPLTDKPYQVPASRTDKQTGLEKYTEYPRPDVELVLLVHDEFLGKKRIKCRPINKS